jgi:putative Holliday junction resolvase
MTSCRTLAIDYGSRRIGLALSDSAASLATPLKVLPANSESIPQILKIISAESVDRIIIGFPLNMDGTRGPAAQKTLAFAVSLKSKTPKPIIFVDERLSTFEAEQTLTHRRQAGDKLTRKSKKQRLDAVAAAQFLQDFLDGKVGQIEI